MNTSERLIYDIKNIQTAATGTNNLRTNKVKPNRIQIVKLIAVENKTTTYTKLRIGIWDNGVFMPFFEETAPLVGELYFITDEIILRDGQQVQAELQGCTAGDNIEMYVHGRWEPDTWEESGNETNSETP